jgi:hypothetical protein
MKKSWEKPKLIVLYRGRSEEHVLKHCKRPGVSGPVIVGCSQMGGMNCLSAHGT